MTYIKGLQKAALKEQPMASRTLAELIEGLSWHWIRWWPVTTIVGQYIREAAFSMPSNTKDWAGSKGCTWMLGAEEKLEGS